MNDEENLRVRYRRRNKVVEGTSAIDLDNNPAYMTEFIDGRTAREFYKKFQGESIPNFCNVKWIHKKLAVLVDEGYAVFDPTQILCFHIWSYNSIRSEIVAMGYSFVKLFKGIFIGLDALYSKEFPHGNIRNGITISRDLDVKLFNVGKRMGNIGDGIRKDLEDLRELILIVIDSNPHDQSFKTPECVSLFRAFDALFRNITHPNNDDTWKFEAYFFFKNPIFGDGSDRIVLMKKFINLNKLTRVDSVIKLDKAPALIGQWWFRIPLNGYIQRIIHYGMHKYLEGRSIIEFCKDCLRHKHSEGMDEVAVEAALLETYPDLLPKFFYEFVEKLAWQQFPHHSYMSYLNYFQEADPKI